MEKTQLELEKTKRQLEKFQNDTLWFLKDLFQNVTSIEPNALWREKELAEELKNYLENLLALLPEHIYWQNKEDILDTMNNKQKI